MQDMAKISTKNLLDGTTGVEMNLLVLLYQEDGIFFVYAPELDLTGYGESKEAAMESFDTVLEGYLQYTFENNTLHEDLLAHGWTADAAGTSPIKPPSFNEMVNRNKEFKKRVDKGQVVVASGTVRFPAYA